MVAAPPPCAARLSGLGGPRTGRGRPAGSSGVTRLRERRTCWSASRRSARGRPSRRKSLAVPHDPVWLGVLRLAAQPVLASVTAGGCDIVRRAWSPEAFVWLRFVKLRLVMLRLSGVPDRLQA